MDNLAIICDEVIDADADVKLDNEAKSYSDVKSNNEETNFNEKKATCKTQNFYILFAFSLITIA